MKRKMVGKNIFGVRNYFIDNLYPTVGHLIGERDRGEYSMS